MAISAMLYLFCLGFADCSSASGSLECRWQFLHPRSSRAGAACPRDSTGLISHVFARMSPGDSFMLPPLRDLHTLETYSAQKMQDARSYGLMYSTRRAFEAVSCYSLNPILDPSQQHQAFCRRPSVQLSQYRSRVTQWTHVEFCSSSSLR